MATQLPDILIMPGDFDITRARMLEPTAQSFTPKGGNPVEWVESQVRYTGADGVEGVPYIVLPEAKTFGFNINYPMGADMDYLNANPNEAFKQRQGYQTAYPMTGLNTVDNPTPLEFEEDGTVVSGSGEQYAIDVFNAIFGLTVETMESECTKEGDEIVVPEPSFGSYSAALARKKPISTTIKPIYAHPNGKELVKGKKIPDTTKPQKAYIKLMTAGKGANLRVKTPIHGPGNKDVHPDRFLNKLGILLPVVQWSGIYWGAHGKTTYGASCKLRISECCFTPGTGNQPRSRMLPSNDAPEEDEDSTSDEGTGFKNPVQQPEENGAGFKESNNPAEELMGANASDSDGEGPAPPKPKKSKGSGKSKKEELKALKDKKKAAKAAKKKEPSASGSESD
jgi:hypothetical protein